MTVKQQVKTLVKNRKEAEEVVAELLYQFSSDTAWDRTLTEATKAKQTAREIVRRRVNNLFNSLTPYRQ